ncbi:MAG: hypothetical protein BGO07_00835 [Alphaproteobacteria bacterium 40-19]|nr:MAG: hypothetical protein BGO07_00835 [Alphaproteobacteria bacterium 40-19]
MEGWSKRCNPTKYENEDYLALMRLFFPQDQILPRHLESLKNKLNFVKECKNTLLERESFALLIRSYPVENLEFLFNEDNHMKIGFFVDHIVTDYEENTPVPGGTLSKWSKFLEDKIESYPSASSFVKMFRKFFSVGKNIGEANAFDDFSRLFNNVFPDFYDPNLWIENNPKLVALANDIEKATTSKRFTLLLEEYLNSEK